VKRRENEVSREAFRPLGSFVDGDLEDVGIEILGQFTN
jgi:hypothetical protein